MITPVGISNLDNSLNLLKSLQTILNKIFNLELSEGQNDELQSCFKVLIFDDYAYDIICPFLKVNIILNN